MNNYPNIDSESDPNPLNNNINPSLGSSSPLLQEEKQPLPNVQVPQKQVYDFRKNTTNYSMITKHETLAEGKPLTLEQLSLFGADPVNFEFEVRSDSNLSESDVPRIARELAHKRKKQEKLKKEEERKAAEQAEQADNVRAPDAQNVQQLIGGNGGRQGGNNNRFLNADGMAIPPVMRNYRERQVLRGLIHLRQCERVDLFWGYFKDVERDFIYSHLFIMGLTLLVLLTIAFQQSGEQYNGNI